VLFPSSSSSIGVDLFGRLEEHAKKASSGDAARVFYETLLQPPPSDLSASAQDVAMAAKFFLDNSAQIAQGLSFFGLAGGFAR
jgi:hypothetical protein